MRFMPRARQNRSASVSERARDLDVVDRVEEAEETGLVLPHAQVLAVDRRGAAPDEAAVLPRREERDVRAIEERVVLGIEPLADLEAERRDPRWIAFEDLVSGAHEITHVATGLVSANLDAHRPYLSRSSNTRMKSSKNVVPRSTVRT